MRLTNAFTPFTFTRILVLLIVYLQIETTIAHAKEKLSNTGSGDDLYKLLGVAKDATLKEIRKAFKNLAVLQHPDKNPDDPEATEKFIRLTRGYDILKDPEMRKNYDLYGDADLGGPNTQFKSYSYYQNDFGIYDDDPLIVTLSKADYELNVLDENQAWWINFYSPACHHCHKLAPTWRTLAQELEGVVRIAAVNCEDDWVLCHQLNINAYPSLLYYEKEAHLYDGEKYTGPKYFDEMQDFILSKVKVNIEQMTVGKMAALKDSSTTWLLFLCSGNTANCPDPQTQIKLAAVFDGLMSIGIVEDETLCAQISPTHASQPIVLYQPASGDKEKEPIVTPIAGSDRKEIVDSILNMLPTPEHLNEIQFSDIRTDLRDKQRNINAWLICFYLGTPTELNLQLKRLPALIPNINIGLIHCGKTAPLCSALHVSHYPAWGLLKTGGAFELYHGRDVLHEVADFARDGSKATNLHALSPADYKGVLEEGSPWFIDWYAPWCPPCRRLMPQIRKASQHFQPSQIQFGTIDCTLHAQLCSSENIRAYPTTILLNKGERHQYHGALNEEDIAEYVEDMLNPSMLTLNEDNFIELMRKREGAIWVVDYYAPWCGPCQQLLPVWRSLARHFGQLKDKMNASVVIASVDCVAHQELCNQQNIRSYPMIRLYPAESKGLNSVAMYTGHRDLLNLKNWIFGFVPSKVVQLSSDVVKKRILKKKLDTPWLVDFYAPWCGHCVDFEPKFRQIAEELDGVVRSGKLDCQAERMFCIELQVTSYPTLRLYFSKKDYRVIDAQDADYIVQEVQRLVNGHSNHDEL